MARNSKGQSGKKSQVSIGGPTGDTLSTSWNLIAEITDFPFKLPDIKTTPTTHLQSDIETAAPVIQALTKLDVKATRVGTDPGQLAVVAAYGAMVPYDFKVQLPPNPAIGQTSTGDMWTFSAYVLAGDLGIKPDSNVDFNFSLQYDSGLTYTQGS